MPGTPLPQLADDATRSGAPRLSVPVGRGAVGPDTMTVVARLPGAVGAPAEPATLVAAAEAARAAGAHLLVVPAVPRLVSACRQAGLPVAATVGDPAQVAAVALAADLLLIPGAAMADGALLDAVAASGQAVLLERARDAGVEAWLAAAERLAPAKVILVEAGSAPAGPGGPTLLDLTVVPAVRAGSALPLIVDPGAAAGSPGELAALVRAAAAAGADGVVLPAGAPGAAPADLAALVADLRDEAGLHGRRLAGTRIRYVGAHITYVPPEARG